MALSPRAYVPNPYLAYVWFKVRGEVITLDAKERPAALLGFDYTRSVDNTGNIATINLIDKDKDHIEPMLIGLGTTPVFFKYGYTDGNQSPWYSAIVQTYTTDYVVEGTLINVTLMTSGLAGTLKDERKKSRPWTGKLVSEIVLEIANQRGWVVEDGAIEKTKKLDENSDLISCKLDHKVFTQQNMTDEQFITEVLVPRAVRDKDLVSGYKFWFDDSDVSTAKVNFRPPAKDGEAVREFHFMSDKMSEVLSYKPRSNAMNLLPQGAGIVGLPYMDQMTGEYGVEEVYDANTPEKTLLGGNLTSIASPNEEKQHSVPLRVVRDKEQANYLARETFYKMSDLMYDATLQVMGDPLLKPFTVIKVIFTHIPGKIHYTSGKWFILQIKDSIKGGKFTSTLTLQRNAMREDLGASGDVGTGKVNA